jgi:predicted N-acyltransferase
MSQISYYIYTFLLLKKQKYFFLNNSYDIPNKYDKHLIRLLINKKQKKTKKRRTIDFKNVSLMAL